MLEILGFAQNYKHLAGSEQGVDGGPSDSLTPTEHRSVIRA